MAFPVRAHGSPAIEVRVNFGIFTGREATPAEIDRLADGLLDEVGDVSIISEDRHEIDAQAEGVVHQVRIEVAELAGRDRDDLERRILERAERWARLCVAERRSEITDGV